MSLWCIFLGTGPLVPAKASCVATPHVRSLCPPPPASALEQTVAHPPPIVEFVAWVSCLLCLHRSSLNHNLTQWTHTLLVLCYPPPPPPLLVQRPVMFHCQPRCCGWTIFQVKTVSFDQGQDHDFCVRKSAISQEGCSVYKAVAAQDWQWGGTTCINSLLLDIFQAIFGVQFWGCLPDISWKWMLIWPCATWPHAQKN